jgi:hypothetical protein
MPTLTAPRFTCRWCRLQPSPTTKCKHPAAPSPAEVRALLKKLAGGQKT